MGVVVISSVAWFGFLQGRFQLELNSLQPAERLVIETRQISCWIRNLHAWAAAPLGDSARLGAELSRTSSACSRPRSRRQKPFICFKCRVEKPRSWFKNQEFWESRNLTHHLSSRSGWGNYEESSTLKNWDMRYLASHRNSMVHGDWSSWNCS